MGGDERKTLDTGQTERKEGGNQPGGDRQDKKEKKKKGGLGNSVKEKNTSAP